MYRASKLIASASVNFSLQNDSRTIAIDFINNCDIDSLLMELSSDGFHPGSSLSLHFENLKGNDLLPVIDVYLNLYDECVPNEKNYVGAMALYGLSESSTKSHEHDGSGQHRVFDVSQIFIAVRSQSNWSKRHFKLTLVPYHSPQNDASLTIGRIALYFNES